MNVVPSQEEFETFVNEKLRPAFEQAGEGNIVPQLTFFPVYNVIRS